MKADRDSGPRAQARQAALLAENARLLEALDRRSRSLATALEQQCAQLGAVPARLADGETVKRQRYVSG